MDRYMIEHPDWLPAEGKAELLKFDRDGEDKGRIYRVSRSAIPLAHVPRLDSIVNAEVVQYLHNSNGWVRDMAQQLLIWNNDPNAIRGLEQAQFLPTQQSGLYFTPLA